MTTIAYKDNIIAYDSRSCKGNTIFDDDSDKHVEEGGVHFFMCGDASKCGEFLSAYHGEPNDVEIEAFMIKDGKVYLCSVNDMGEFWSVRSKTWAIGSGSEFALAAMDLGKSAKDAVKVAMKRDTGTGGKIRTFKV